MQRSHDFSMLAMELRPPYIKPPKLYVLEHIDISWVYKIEAKWEKE